MNDTSITRAPRIRAWGRADRRFFATTAGELAQRLIGCRLVRVLHGGIRVSGVIVETEAYLGAPDTASHARGGRRTRRTEPMYGPPGTAYVYFTYGMHYCMNAVCGQVDEPVAVLIRALHPLEGLDFMRSRRGVDAPTSLCSGPAKLCQAMDIEREFSGVDLVEHPALFIERPPAAARSRTLTNTARIGVGNADEWARAPLRWFDPVSDHVSHRPVRPAGRRAPRSG
ncbi:MAG: DNA-3-methyladenine glycosylase [Phycisphaeraceae bacterium]|nr:DNA-3-methyladenine glycosylase [Phycisphaeraceae bacterium]